MATATFAAGCFWGIEAAFRKLDGVIETQVGYTGGKTKAPSYEAVCRGDTGHAEAVRVTYDPDTVDFDRLLATFWEVHDPTQVDRQGPDIGSQYRSAIFVHDEEQRRVAESSRRREEESGRHAAPIATEVMDAGPFWPAEEFHQQYFEKRGRGLFSGLFGDV